MRERKIKKSNYETARGRKNTLPAISRAGSCDILVGDKAGMKTTSGLSGYEKTGFGRV